MLLTSDLGEIVLSPSINGLWCALAYWFGDSADISLEVELETVGSTVQDPFFRHRVAS